MTASNPFAHLGDHMLAVIRAKMLPPEPVFTPEELSHFGGWVKATGMKPEGARDFDLGKYPYQVDLYDERRDALRSRVVIMKAAQTGLTVKLLNRSMWLTADVKRQINVGLGFPTRDAVEQLAASRFKPQMYTSARMIELIRDVNRVDLVRLGTSNMRFLGLMSGVTADSNPLDAELVDEVRLVPSTTIERFMVRVSESTLVDQTGTASNGARGLIELNSTAGFPNQDIHRYFLDSTQGYWATPCPDHKCRRSRSGIILAREFAESPGRVVGRRDDGRYHLKCPTCGAHITDDMQQRGFYIHENPGALWLGYHFSQLVKGEDFLNTEIMPAWERGINVPEFYNSRLGLPYMDTDAVPAAREIVERCCDDTLTWPREGRGRDGKWRAMGIDQRAPEKHVVIKSLDGNGNEVLEHVAVIEASGEDAAREIVRMAREWGCTIVVIDGEPSYDLAIMVARALPKGTVWFSDYVENQPTTLKWEDKRSDKAIKKSSGETKYEYRVLVDRYKGLDWSLGMFARQKIRLPNRAELYELRQPRNVGGVNGWASVSDEYVAHLGNLARYRAPKMMRLANGESAHIPGEYVLRWRYLHVDPHFAHANLSASVGLARRAQMGGLDGVWEPEPQKPGPYEAGAPRELRSDVVRERTAVRRANVCGVCKHFRRDAELPGEGFCTHPALTGRTVIVGERDNACEEHVPAETT
ncbi:Phage terminase large subunit (GpA) (plasmid) [Deinococcus geothermalis DSM 11300]|uniref:Phage terminase large subunit (GpA) n=1 Tax=Deinococcus geothermalis (strain DSM 11300 / CIP 105573 / AG-3a) TaxID=319795 RepID=A8ZRJ2_DEIGD|nr:phage terminase large subunit family protein [Deinococcus geothermalis]ABW35101.1 Phage terminase large subunit (GpA) [Deinococcus geothermalis DSM 11300]